MGQSHRLIMWCRCVCWQKASSAVFCLSVNYEMLSNSKKKNLLQASTLISYSSLLCLAYGHFLLSSQLNPNHNSCFFLLFLLCLVRSYSDWFKMNQAGGFQGGLQDFRLEISAALQGTNKQEWTEKWGFGIISAVNSIVLLGYDSECSLSLSVCLYENTRWRVSLMTRTEASNESPIFIWRPQDHIH